MKAEILFLVFCIASVAAWFTHVIYCLIEGMRGFLVAGALLFPIAIVHGVLIWFGVGS